MKVRVCFILLFFHTISIYGQWKYKCDINSREYDSCTIDIDSNRELDFVDTLERQSLIPRDTICQCIGTKQALKDTQIVLLFIGDPTHVSQYIFHKYAEKNIKLILTGDIVAFGQQHFNHGYNTVSTQKIRLLYPNWDYFKPFRKSYKKKGLHNYEIQKKLEKNIKSNHQGDSVFIQLTNNPYSRKMQQCNATVLVNYNVLTDTSYSLSDLEEGIYINVSGLNPTEIKQLELGIDLNNFTHKRYNWYLTEERNKVYLDI